MWSDLKMFYRHNNAVLELKGSKGTLFVDDKLIFKGFGYHAIKMYISACGNDPEASKPFKKQLSMREACRFENQDKLKRENEKLASK